MPEIIPAMTRVAYVTTTNTGGTLDIVGPEGRMEMRRADPHGVLIKFNGQQLSVHKDLLPILGRFFMAAGLLLGVDINEGWNSQQTDGVV